MVFHWSLSDSRSPQVSRTRLRILTVLSNAVVWIVSNRPPTFKSSRPFNNPLVIVPNAPITIGTIVTFMFHSLFNSLARSRYLFLFSHSLDLFCGLPGQQSRQFCKFSYYHYYYYYYYLLLLWEFFIPALADSFSLEFEWQQVSSSLFSVFSTILIMLLTGWTLLVLFFSKSFSPFTNTLRIVSSAPTTIGINVTFMFHSLFVFVGFSWVFFFFVL